MNRILFFSSEIEQFSVAQKQGQHTLCIPLHDARAQHIIAVLSQKNKSPASQYLQHNAPASGMTLQAGIVDESMGTLTVTSYGEGMLQGIYAPLSHGAFRSTFNITVIIAHPRPPVMARLIRDLTTLGVRRIIVCASRLSEKSYLQSSLWNTVSTTALIGAMQAKVFNTIPDILYCYSVQQACARLQDTRNNYDVWGYFTETATESFSLSLARRTQKPQGAVLVIGAERGFTEQEEEQLSDYGFCFYTLGTATLRTETAAVVAVGLYATYAIRGCVT